MTLDAIRVALVTNGGAFADEVTASLRAGGAELVVCAPDRDLWSVLASHAFDAIVLADAGEVRGLARALEEEPRTRSIPSFLVRPPGSSPRLASVGSLRSVEAGEALPGLLATAVQERRARGRSKPPGAMARKRAAAVAHDVRVLLGIVVGFAGNLRDAITGSLDASGREHARKIVAAATDASALLEQLVSGEGGEDSGMSSRPPPAQPVRVAQRTHLDLVLLVRRVLALFEGHASDSGVDVRLEGAASVHLWGDPLQLKQVVTNLVVNAIKFTPRGGRVTVTVRLADGAASRGHAGRRVAELVVADSGPGVPAAERDRVFDRGVRLARDAGVPGSGIGLSVVRDLVVRHGGAVTLGESDAGGAQFVARLPLDLRGRPRDAVVVVREAKGLEELVRAIGDAQRRGDLTRPPAELRAALDECRAVVLVADAASLLSSDDEDGAEGEGETAGAVVSKAGGSA